MLVCLLAVPCFSLPPARRSFYAVEKMYSGGRIHTNKVKIKIDGLEGTRSETSLGFLPDNSIFLINVL
jgi:hypothetical protein